MQTSNCSHRPALGEVATLTHHSKPELTLKTTNWKSWTYTDCVVSKKANSRWGRCLPPQLRQLLLGWTCWNNQHRSEGRIGSWSCYM